MRNLLFISIVLASYFVNGQTQQVYEHSYLVKVGDTAPNFTINELNGKSYKLYSLRGSVVMLQFTASWCSVCRKEMPYIENEIWQIAKDKGLKIIGIDRGEDAKIINKFVEQTKVSYPLAFDKDVSIFSKFALKNAGVTRNVIINRYGKIVFLTRLFNRIEFDKMKKILFNELKIKTEK